MTTPSEPIIYFRPLTLSNSVELYWYPPLSDGGSPITSYIIECANISYINVLPSTDRKSTIRNLITGNTYVFTMKATNINGNSNIASYNFVMPGFKPNQPTNLDFTTNISNVSKYSTLNLNFNNPTYTGNSNIIYNVATMIPVDVTGNVLNNSQFIKNHSNEGTNNMDPFSYDDFNTNYNYKTYVQSINTVNSSDQKYYDYIINPSLPTNGLKLWLDPYDVSTIKLSNSKIINWQDKSKNQANAIVSGANIFMPNDLSGLVLWLDANDTSTLTLSNSTVTQWRDKSGLNNHTTSSSGNPIYVVNSLNNKNGISFNNSQFIVPRMIIYDWSIFIVLNTTQPNSTGGVMWYHGYGVFDMEIYGLQSDFGTAITNGRWTIGVGSPDGDQSVQSVRPVNNGGTYICNFLRNGLSGEMQNFVNGNLEVSVIGPTGVKNWAQRIAIGSQQVNEKFFLGNIYEIVVFDRVLNSSERQKVEGYLSTKWGNQSSLVSNHSYINSTPITNVNSSSAQLLYEILGPTYDSSNALIKFDGSQYLNLPANTLPSANSSYSIFTYVSTSNISKNNQWFLYSGTPTPNLSLGGFVNSNTFIHSWCNNQITANSNISTNISYLLELTYDNGIISTYVNGNLITQSTATNKNSDFANNLIGTNSTFNGNLEGSIGDIIIYNRLLNPHERLSVKNYLERKKYNLSLHNIGNVITWLDASDPNNLYDSNNEIKVSYNNKVFNWNDRSYANNNATQSNVSVLPIRRPYIQNNLDVLEFNQSFLTIPSAYYPIDAFMVLKLNNTSYANGIIGISPNSNNYSSLTYDNTWKIDNTSNSVISNISDNAANFLLMEWSIGNNNNFIKRYGSNIANVTTGTWSLPNNSNIIIGNSNGFNFNKNFRGYIGEIIMFNKQLDDDYRSSIEGYLAWKWGLQSYLSNSHPYKNSAPYLFDKYKIESSIIAQSPIVYSLFSPDDIVGLQTWYDAKDPNTLYSDTNATTLATTGNGIARWNDKSGNGNYLYQNTSGSRPIYQQFNSLPGIYFNDNTKGLASINNNTTTGSMPRTVFALIYAPNDNSLFTIGTGAHAGATPPTAFGMGIVNSSQVLYYPYIYNVSDNFTGARIKTLTLVQFDYVNNTISGKYNFTNQNSKSISINTSVTPWYFGSRPDGQTSNDSYLCEFLQYNRALSVNEIQQIEGYIAWKWGINSNLPTNHPFYSVAPYTNISFQFIPSSIVNQQLWLDASDPYANKTRPNNTISLTSWKDKSSSNIQVTALGTTPNYTNNSVSFNGAGLYNTTFTAGLSNETTFVVYNVNNITGFQQFIGSQEGGRQFFFGTSPNGSLYVKKTYVNDLIRPPSITISSQVDTILMYQNDSSNVSLTLNASSNIANTSVSFNQNTTSLIGAYAMLGGGYGDFLNGKIKEIIAYSSVLSNENKQKLEGYLAWKWNMVANLPSNHPYKNYIPLTYNTIILRVSQLFGYAGFNITIDGYNLTGPVTFNGVSANIQSNTGTSMTVIIPTGATTGNLLINSVNAGTFTILSNNSFTPDQIQNINVWFDGADPLGNGTVPANGSTINTWVDKSLNKRNAIAINPATYVSDSPGYLNFNGTNTYYNFDGVFLSQKYFTIFIVERLQGIGQFQTTTLLGGTIREYSQNLLIRYMGNTSGFNIDYFANGIGGTVQTAITAFTSASTQPTRIWTISQKLNSRQIFVNGNPYLSDSNNVLLWANFGYSIGRDPIDINTSYTGHIKDLIFYTGTMSDINTQKVEGYLAWKWGIQSSLPYSHPFKNTAPYLTAFSPSIYLPWSWFDSSDTSSISLSGSNVTSIQNKGSCGTSITPSTVGQVTYNSSYTMNGFNLITVNKDNSLRLLNTNYSWNGSCIMVVIKHIQGTASGQNTWFMYGGGSQPQIGLSNFNLEWGLNGVAYYGLAENTPGVSANSNVLLVFNVGGSTNSHNALGINGTNYSLTVNSTTTGNSTLSWDITTTAGASLASGPVVSVAEHVIFNRGLNTYERQQMEGYLAWKWGLQSSLPSNHPYKNSAP